MSAAAIILSTATLAPLPPASALDGIGCYVPGQCAESQVLAVRSLKGDPNPRACLEYCQKKDFCKFWTFFQDTYICEALSDCNSFLTSCDDCTSGDIGCGPAPPVEGCTQSGLCIGGEAIGRGFVTDTEADCNAACLASSEPCQYASFNGQGNLCLLTLDCPALNPCESCTHAQATCVQNQCIMPSIIEEDPTKYPETTAETVFINECDGNRNYWLLVPEADNQGFTVDLSCQAAINKFLVKNTHGYPPASDSGTKEFKIEVSEDNVNWIEAAQGTLQDVRDLGQCKSPVEEFSSSVASGRYIRFTAVSFYGKGAGLQYLGFE